MVSPHGKLYSYLITLNEIRSAMKGQVNAKPQVTLLLTASADAENESLSCKSLQKCFRGLLNA